MHGGMICSSEDDAEDGDGERCSSDGTDDEDRRTFIEGKAQCPELDKESDDEEGDGKEKGPK